MSESLQSSNQQKNSALTVTGRANFIACAPLLALKLTASDQSLASSHGVAGRGLSASMRYGLQMAYNNACSTDGRSRTCLLNVPSAQPKNVVLRKADDQASLWPLRGLAGEWPGVRDGRRGEPLRRDARRPTSS